MPHSLKSRLALLILIGLGLLLSTAGLALEIFVTSWLSAQFDEALAAKARALVTLTKQEAGQIELDFADQFMPEFESVDDPEFFQMWIDDSIVLERSRSLLESDLHREPSVEISGDVSSPRFQNTDLPDGRRGRQIQIDFVPQIDDDEDDEGIEEVSNSAVGLGKAKHVVTLVVAKSREEFDQQLRLLRTASLLMVLALTGAAAVLILAALRLGLRPLEDMQHQVQALDERYLDQRIELPKAPAELEPVVHQLNGLLARLHKAFQRERRLSDDLAHELRTPIAELRALTDVGSRWPGDAASAQTFYQAAGDIALQMERIVEHLLALARMDGGLETRKLQALDVNATVDQLWRAHEVQARQRDLTFRADIASGSRIITDPAKLQMILTNLFDNAASYAAPGSEVECAFRREAEGFSLSVSNRADDIEAKDLPLLFDRFWRKDPARSDSLHTGLGLSLARSFAELLELELDARLEADHLLVLRIRGREFPLDSAEDDSVSTNSFHDPDHSDLQC